MGSFKELTEDVAEATKIAKQLALKASKRAWTRVLLMAVVGILVMGSYSVYLTYLVSEYSEISKEHIAKYDLLKAESSDQRTLDYLELCINATKSNDVNKEYYCRQAVALYKGTFIDVPNNGVAENIKRSAYGLMSVEIANKLRVIALERATGASPKMDETLKFLLSTTGISIAILVGLLAMVSSILMSYRLSNQRPPKETESDETDLPL
ncbi:hypothetical protein D9M68_169580 [compost metagenome]